MKPPIPGMVSCSFFDYIFVPATGKVIYLLRTCAMCEMKHFHSLKKPLIMGKMNKGILDEFSGTIGTVVGGNTCTLLCGACSLPAGRQAPQYYSVASGHLTNGSFMINRHPHRCQRPARRNIGTFIFQPY
jgi:hypothetical protein